MTTDELRNCFDALSRGDVGPMESMLDENVAFEFPGRRFGGTRTGARAVTIFLRQNQRLFRGGLRFTVDWAGVADDRAIVQWHNEGTTREGRLYANRGVTVFTLEADRIVRIDDYLDTEAVSETWPARD